MAIAKFKTALFRPCCPPYQMVFMDINMPEMDGLATTKELQRVAAELDALTPRVIVVSAYDTKQHKEHFKSIGVTEFEAKPLAMARLNAILDSHFRT